MSQLSTSKILGKLSNIKGKSATIEVEAPEMNHEEQYDVPQLKKNEEPDMKNVLTHILGQSCSKKNSPMDK